jgi:prevent-host-death family protein
MYSTEAAMTKVVSATEFKAKCLKLIDEMQKDGEPVTVTKRGKVVAELTPKSDVPHLPVIGMLRSPAYRFDWDPSEPATDPSDWNALR